MYGIAADIAADFNPGFSLRTRLKGSMLCYHTSVPAVTADWQETYKQIHKLGVLYNRKVNLPDNSAAQGTAINVGAASDPGGISKPDFQLHLSNCSSMHQQWTQGQYDASRNTCPVCLQSQSH